MGDESFDLRVLAAVVVVTGLVVGAVGLHVLQDSRPAPSDGQPMPSPPPVTTTSGAPGTTTPDGEAPGTVSVELDAADPGDVRNAAGHVSRRSGRLNGTVTWDVTGQRTLTVVVNAWVPEDGWTQKRYVERQVDANGRVTLADVLDQSPVTYASADRASAFDNPDDGTTAVREGYVAVSAIVSADGESVREQAVDGYAFAVTNLAGASGGASRSDDADGDSGQPDAGDDQPAVTPSLAVSSQGLLGVQNAVPGQSGTSSTTLTNEGESAGDLAVLLDDLLAAENGLADPERSVDSPGDGGELQDHLEVRIALVRADGTRTYVVGGSDSFVRASDLESGILVENYRVGASESVRVVAEWRIPPSTGNEIQTDGVAVNVSYVLTSA